MKILVTGGAGFIGSHLCGALFGGGDGGGCLDNFWTGSRENISRLPTGPAFRLIEHDVRDPLPREDFDLIFHLASPASPVDYATMPGGTLLINSIGCRNVLDLAVNAEAGIFLASTSEV